MIANPHPIPMLLSLQSPLQRQQIPQILQTPYRKLVKQTLPLRNQIRYIGRIPRVIRVPTPIYGLTILMRRHPRYQHHLPPTPNQMLSQRLMIIPRRLQTENNLPKPRLNFQRFGLHQNLFESLYVIFKDQTLAKRLPGGRAKKRMMPLFGYINANDQILRRFPNLPPELTKLLQPGMIFFVHDKPPALEFEFGGTYSYF